MRSTITLAAAVAAASLLPLVSAVADPNTVQLDFQKRKVDARDNISRRLARRQTVNTAIDNEYILYLINVTVGTPGQPLSLQLDTGSSDIWFPSAQSSICTRANGQYCQLGSYDASASSSSASTDLGPFEISYVDGTHITGDYVRDTLTVGGTTVTNLTMASATELEQGYGIMGIGFSSDESSNAGATPFTYPNIIDVLQSQGKINTRSYSLWLDDVESNTGSILFGGVDTDKYEGSLIAIPIQKDSFSGNFTSFTVAWTGLTVTGGGQTSNFNPSSAQPIILDSGTTDTLLPDDIANNIFNGVGALSDQEYGMVVPCSLANDDLTFAFEFGGSSGPKINVSVAEFVVPLLTTSGNAPKFQSGQYSGQEACSFGIEAAGSNPLLFGDTFLRSAYVVYDLDNLEIGMATTNRNSNTGTGNVQAFSVSAGMPDATTTVTSVSVAQTYTGTGDLLGATQTATGTGDAAGGASSVRATFSLVATGSGSGSGSGSTNAAVAAPIPQLSRSTFVAVAVTLVGFFAGGALMF